MKNENLDDDEDLTLFDKAKNDYTVSNQTENLSSFSKEFKHHYGNFIVMFASSFCIIIVIIGVLISSSQDISPPQNGAKNNYSTITYSATSAPTPPPTPLEEEVYITPTGECYHAYPHGNGSFTRVYLSEALDLFLRPCNVCNP